MLFLGDSENTTAATIWVAAAVGLCAGIGFHLTALATTLFVLVILVTLTPLTRWIGERGSRKD